MLDLPHNSASGNQAFLGSGELDLKMYARLLLQWAWLIILCTVIAAVAGYIVSDLSVPIYQTSSTLLVNSGRNTSVTYQDMVSGSNSGQTYAELIVRPTTLAKVAQQLNVTPEVLDDALTSVNATLVRDTQLMKVTIEGTSPELVAVVANALPLVFSDELNTVQAERFKEAKINLEQRIQTLGDQIDQTQVAISRIGDSHTPEEGVDLNRLRNQLTQLQGNYNSLLQSLETLNLTAAQTGDKITIVEQAKVPLTPIRPRKLNNTLLAAIVGAMLALGIIFLIDYLDDRVRTPQDLERIIDTSVLSTISQLPGQKNRRWRRKSRKDEAPPPLISINEPRHPIAESYRTLRSNLQFASVDVELNALLITSSTESEGKTTTAANLGVVMAQSGKRVILVDADLRKPRLNRYFNLPRTPGLTEAMWIEDDSIAAYLRDTEVNGLRVLSSGKIPPNPADLLGSHRMQRLVESLKKEADIIIFDAPPVLAVTDSAILSQLAQGVLLVIDTSRTTRASVSRAVETLAHAKANLFGVVFNRMMRDARSYGYYYYDSYDRYYGDDVDSSTPPSNPDSGSTPGGSGPNIKPTTRQSSTSGYRSPQPQHSS